MKCKFLLPLLTISGVFLSSCASIVHGPMQSVGFTSTPVGASIFIDGREFGKTPNTIYLRRKGREIGQARANKFYTVRIELDGYTPYEFQLNRKVDGWFFGNILIGGVIGIIIDASNGSMYKFSPSQLDFNMNKSALTSGQSEEGLYFSVALEVDPNWEKIGTLSKLE